MNNEHPRLGRRAATAARGAIAVALILTGSVASADDNTSFSLNAGLGDLPAYFPTLLGNGYIATFSSPRGTDATRSYLVGLMDYAAGDMSRPASIPGWSQIDFNSGPAGSAYAWLDRTSMGPRHFKDYSQTLDLHGATLTTRYRFVDRDHVTAVEVTTFVSEASPHLAATQIKLMPDFDGTVQLSFPLLLWAEHAPRFPLGLMTGPEMEEAVAANELPIEARPPAAPDREAVWYPGYTEILARESDVDSLSLWVDGKAERGLETAMAAALALPDGLRADKVSVKRDAYRLSLELSVKVERGRSYVFTKYVAMSRAGWGGGANEDLALAREARARGFDRLLGEHRAAWDALWQSDIEIDGDAQAQQVVHSEIYYLLASSTASTAWALGACSLTPGYTGHIFWDSDTWIFPALLLLHPDRAKSLVAFRARTLEAAQERARAHGFEGAMFPWESDPENGSEQVPHPAIVLGDTEIHVNADVAIAQWQYYLATLDRDWLRAQGWPVIREVARFWASRATYNPSAHHYNIDHVNSVAESNTDIPNDTFTNVSAAKALTIATSAARVLGEKPDPLWSRVAAGLYIPFASDHSHHLPFDPSVPGYNEDFGGGPLSLLFLPSLDLEMSPELRRADYEYAIGPTLSARTDGSPMGNAPRLVAAATVGSSTDAAAWFSSFVSGASLKPPFNVRTESSNNNTGYFLTGSGGYVQSLLYGFSGLRIRDGGLVEAYAPVLPPTWKSLTLHNLSFRGQHLDIRVVRDASGAVRLTREIH